MLLWFSPEVAWSLLSSSAVGVVLVVIVVSLLLSLMAKDAAVLEAFQWLLIWRREKETGARGKQRRRERRGEGDDCHCRWLKNTRCGGLTTACWTEKNGEKRGRAKEK